MSSIPSPPDPAALQPGDLLQTHLRSLRALARQLTRDAHAAEDAVQDAAVAALSTRSGPAPGGRAARSWLAQVLRNCVRQRAREEARRTARERRSLARTAGAPNAAPSAADVAAELALHGRLVELVRALDEPYRETVFLRFWRGMTAREIGARLGVPHKTIHTRLERGLLRLRAKLQAEHGDRRGWLMALWPLAAGPGPRTAFVGFSGTVLLMKTKLMLGAAVLITALALLPLLANAGDDLSPPRPQGQSHPSALQSAPASSDVPAAARAPIVASEATESRAVDATSAPVPQLRGVVRTVDGRPVPGIAVTFAPSGVRDEQVATAAAAAAPAPAANGESEAANVVTDATGAFTMPAPGHPGCVAADGPAWATVRRAWIGDAAPAEPVVVVVGPARAYAGTVVGPAGEPVAGADVVVSVEQQLLPTRAIGGQVVGLPHDLAATRTDAQGRFAFARVPWLPGARVVAESEPFTAAATALPEAGALDLLLRLGAARAAAAERLVHGIVVDAAGAPVRDALVAVGGEAVRSREDGRFAARWGWRRPTTVRAAHPRHGAVAARLVEGSGQPGWSEAQPITLRFGPAAGEVRGKVVDANGEAVAGVRVWTPDLTYLGQVTIQERGHLFTRDASVEEMAGESNTPLVVAATTAADGTFALRGLLPRDYALFALAPGDLAKAGPVRAAPGDVVELRLERGNARPLAGRVVSRSGRPMSGVRLSLGRALDWRPPPRDEQPWADSPMVLPRAAHQFRNRVVRTDAAGRFAFDAVHVEGSFLSLEGDELFLCPPFRLSADLPLEELEIVVDARSTFRVHLEQPEEADAFSLRGPNDAHVPMVVRVEEALISVGKGDLVGGRSPEVYSRAGEVTLVLWRGEHEVRRATVTLREGGPHDVRP